MAGPGQSGCAYVQDRLAMKANCRNVPNLDAMILHEPAHGVRVLPSDLLLELCKTTWAIEAMLENGRFLDACLDLLAELLGIGAGLRGSPFDHVLSVRLDQRHVDAVHGRAAHEADCAHDLAHSGVPVHVPADLRPYTRRSRPSNGAMTAMAKHKSDFLNTLEERGFIHQCSDFEGLDALAAKGDVIAYVGYDCTAPSLHIGHLYTIMMLRWLQQTGAGKPITLMGGGTTRVGDPSGRDETRRILSVEQIEANKE